MTETLTSPAAVFPVEAVPATWGWFDTARLATAAEMAAATNHCAECGVLMESKVGGGLVAGSMVGTRTDPAAEWVWAGPWCHGCDKAHGVADGD